MLILKGSTHMRQMITLLALLLLAPFSFANTAIHDLGNGQVAFEIKLPAGQQFVQVFARQNGQQNLAEAITASAQTNGDGTTTYRYVRGGYQQGDQIQYRFYSYLPGQTGVFTPGATESSWTSFQYGQAIPGKLINLGDGKVRFEITLPSTQQYVEIFSRKNGVQNLAVNIVGNGKNNGDGTSTYSIERIGYATGDLVEYRFYSYANGQAPIFTPGTTATNWYKETVSAPQLFLTEEGNYQLGKQINQWQEESFIKVFRQQGNSTAVPAQTGWYLNRATPVDLFTNVVDGFTYGKLKGLYIKPCHSDVWVNIQNTVFADMLNARAELLNPGVDYTADITTNYGMLTGTHPTVEFDCGGNLIPVSTRIGTINVRTNTQVEFAYVVEFTK
jgi:hypothetical protein